MGGSSPSCCAVCFRGERHATFCLAGDIETLPTRRADATRLPAWGGRSTRGHDTVYLVCTRYTGRQPTGGEPTGDDPETGARWPRVVRCARQPSHAAAVIEGSDDGRTDSARALERVRQGGAWFDSGRRRYLRVGVLVRSPRRESAGNEPREIVARGGPCRLLHHGAGARVVGSRPLPARIDTTARVAIEAEPGGFRSTRIVLRTEAEAPGVSLDEFRFTPKRRRTVRSHGRSPRPTSGSKRRFGQSEPRGVRPSAPLPGE